MKDDVSIKKVVGVTCFLFAFLAFLSGTAASYLIINSDFNYFPTESDSSLLIKMILQISLSTLVMVGGLALYRAKPWSKNVLLFGVTGIIICALWFGVLASKSTLQSVSVIFIAILPLSFLIFVLRSIHFEKMKQEQ